MTADAKERTKRSVGDDKPSRALILRLIERARAGAPVAELAEILKTDVVLCYALLAEIRGEMRGPSVHISTAHHAIEALGSERLVEWLELALEHAVDKAEMSPRTRDALIRGKFLVILGKTMLKKEDTEHLYFVGLFAELDKLLGQPMIELILPMPFPEDMQAALLERRGPYGRLLKFAEIIQNADESGMDFMQTTMRLPSKAVYDAYNEAYDWVKQLAP